MTSARAPFRKPWSQPLADLVAPALKPVIGRYGFDEADLLVFWPDIVGARLAARCEPLRLQWPPRTPRGAAGEPATLIVRVEGAFAIELQHQASIVVERVNAHVGWRCVGRLALRQGPLGTRRTGPVAVPPPTVAAVARAKARTADVADEALRDALTRLGSRVLQRGGET
jgi:hypothetical protein